MRKIVDVTRRVFSYCYNHVEVFLLIVFTWMLVTVVLWGILARFIRFEVVFANELGKYLFIWLCAIGISAAAKDNQHVRVNIFVNSLPVNRKAAWIISQILFLVFTLFLMYWGGRLTWMHYSMEKSAMGFQFPMYFFTAALPVGFALTSARLIEDIIRTMKKSGPGNRWGMSIPGKISPSGPDDSIDRGD